MASPRNVTPGALSVLPVAIAAALLSPRLIAIVVAAGLVSRVLAGILGETTALTAVTEMASMLLLALIGREAVANLAIAKRLAIEDALTGLPNRRLFMDRLGLAIRQAERDKTGVCLLMMDLDRLKVVNDTIGHDAGDLLLKQVARAMRSRMRESDTLARLGGDEFALLLSGAANLTQGIRAAERIHEALENPS